MFGAIIGDIVGSVYEFNNKKSKEFPLWSKASHFTDDTVMTCAVYAALREYKNDTTKNAHALIISRMQEFGREFPLWIWKHVCKVDSFRQAGPLQ